MPTQFLKALPCSTPTLQGFPTIPQVGPEKVYTPGGASLLGWQPKSVDSRVKERRMGWTLTVGQWFYVRISLLV